MGLISSKLAQKLPELKDEVPEHGSIPSTPILAERKATKYDEVDGDPRSPSRNISRTPISILTEAAAKLESLQSQNLEEQTPLKQPLLLKIDPRSPAADFNRTPIIIHAENSTTNSTPFTQKPKYNKLFEKVFKSELYTPNQTPPKAVIPPKLLESSPVTPKQTEPDKDKRKSFVGLLETNIDYTETDIDEVFQNKQKRLSRSVQSLEEQYVGRANSDPRSPTTDFMRTPILHTLKHKQDGEKEENVSDVIENEDEIDAKHLETSQETTQNSIYKVETPSQHSSSDISSFDSAEDIGDQEMNLNNNAGACPIDSSEDILDSDVNSNSGVLEISGGMKFDTPCVSEECHNALSSNADKNSEIDIHRSAVQECKDETSVEDISSPNNSLNQNESDTISGINMLNVSETTNEDNASLTRECTQSISCCKSPTSSKDNSTQVHAIDIEREVRIQTPVKVQRIDIAEDVKEFDKKLSSLIYEDGDLVVCPRVVKIKDHNRTPLSDKNGKKASQPKLRVSDKPRKCDSKIPVFRSTIQGKNVGNIQCENTAPKSMAKLKKPQWDNNDKTLVI